MSTVALLRTNRFYNIILPFALKSKHLRHNMNSLNRNSSDAA
jgi:hypothetical protein